MTHVDNRGRKRKRPTEETRTVRAAGVVPWRETVLGLEVLLVHRPRYDDWSWPKGKAEPGEAAPETAARELREETGLDLPLGRPLPPRDYVIGSGDAKHVDYWAAEWRDGQAVRPEDLKEIDRAEWLVPDEALARLSYERDRDLLQDFLALGADRRTRALVVVRHAKSVSRSSWGERPDWDRPLSDRGRKQAKALVRLLAAWGPGQIVTSPSVRCKATVEPLAQATGTPLTEDKWLSEEGFEEDPQRARDAVLRAIAEAASGAGPLVLCTHRPLFPAVMAALSDHLAEGGGAVTLPDGDPYLTKAQALVVHLAPGPRGPRPGPRVVAVEAWKPRQAR